MISFQNAATEDDSFSSASSSDSMATLLAKKMSMSEEAIKTFRETTGKAKINTEKEEEDHPPPKQQQERAYVSYCVGYSF